MEREVEKTEKRKKDGGGGRERGGGRARGGGGGRGKGGEGDLES